MKRKLPQISKKSAIIFPNLRHLHSISHFDMALRSPGNV
jgi:hypothetical protein